MNELQNELQNEALIIDAEYRPALFEDEATELMKLQQKFIKSYIDNKHKMEINEWLRIELKNNLPEKTDVELSEISRDIVETIKVNENNKKFLGEAKNVDTSKENWFAYSLKKSVENLPRLEKVKYLHTLDEDIRSSNYIMYIIITTKSVLINENMCNLHGFIVEKHHVNSFNIEAELKGSEFRAKLLVVKDAEVYGKNSVDIEIKDKSGEVVKRYQSKYSKDIDNATEFIESPDGIKSKPLSKQKSKDLKEKAENNDWNQSKAKKIALDIGRQAEYAALQGCAIGAGIKLATKVYNREEIKHEEVVEKAITSGADFGIKIATAGALKVAVEKGIIKLMPRGTSSGTMANIAYVAIENVKVLIKISTGELTLKQGLERMEETTVVTVSGIATDVKSAAVGLILGPVGVTVAGFLGGTVGYISGAKVGKIIVKGAQKVSEVVDLTIESISKGVYFGVESFCNLIKSFAFSLRSW